MQKQRSVLALIFVLVIAAITVIVTLPTRLGLDLQGGSQLTIQVKTTATIPKIDQGMLEAVRRIVENRVNGLGVSEALVQTVGEDQILVQLPGVNDPQQAERVLGGTAKLEFREQLPGTEAQLAIERQLQQELVAKKAQFKITPDEAEFKANQAALKRSNEAIAKLYKSSELGGENLKDAQAQPTGNEWNVALRFDTKGGELFGELTKNLAGTGRTLGVFLDEKVISSPVVGVEFAQTGITGGNAVIQGRFTTQEANDLAVQLRGGALPVPVEIIENRTVGASLGRDSIQSSITAGIGGLVLVLIFMIAYYRLPGVIADIALLIYALLTWAAFVLLGVTLTLPGIAGFVLSIGMAVDANVLIFERTREELRAGKTLYRSVESGFYRAFSSILDGNVTTLIACAALFWLGAGLVKGFAVTLALGVAVSMFTAITCSRTLMFVVLGFPGLRKPQWFCPDLSKTVNS
ncbi:MAG: protein translocase subunit SecD [Oscillatoriales cyanobacterium]|nr:MAG: protein translocase subunit SecD [Oscillatoriales cyanobacterium]TAH20698.1 MAG: protein translocase subunit SecD [Oscillatoriales cyanobacterium]